MKQKIVILSDIFGEKNKEWLASYFSFLEQDFVVQFYNSLKLAEIDFAGRDKESIHQEFIEKGIEIAVKNLIQLEKEPVLTIGFSIGGTIAWKAASEGLKASKLVLLSATRIRFETEKPPTEIYLIYGADDLNIPSKLWFDNMKLIPKVIIEEGHEFYCNQKTPIREILINLNRV